MSLQGGTAEPTGIMLKRLDDSLSATCSSYFCDRRLWNSIRLSASAAAAAASSSKAAARRQQQRVRVAHRGPIAHG
jgi:hypothetical protein